MPMPKNASEIRCILRKLVEKGTIMPMPQNTSEIRCILRKLVEMGAFEFGNRDRNEQTPMPREVVLQAVEDIVRAMDGAVAGDLSQPTACERLVATMFLMAIEEYVTGGHADAELVTISEV